MIPRFKPALGWEEIRAALTWPCSDDVVRFENAFAEKMGQKHAVAFPYGRTGLVFLLEALGLKDKEIICPAYTCVVVPHAIVTSGNVPVFVDSQYDDFNMDLDLVPETITEKTGAIIATSIFGYPVNLDKLDDIRKKYPHIYIIQDCAHSFAAEWKGRPVQREGTAAIYGLNISKIITSIFGGMVTTDDDNIAKLLFRIREKHLKPASFTKSIRRFFYLFIVYLSFWNPIYGFVNRLERSGALERFSKYYDDNIIDMPNDYLEKMSKVESRVGLVQLLKYDEIVKRRRNIASYYAAKLIDIKELNLPPLIEGSTYSHFVPRVAFRKNVLEMALKQGVQLGWLIEYCIPDMNAYRKRGKIEREYKNAKLMSKSTINLPVYRSITQGQIEKILDILKTNFIS